MIDKQDIQQLINRSQHLRVLVVGDLMLDRYLWGKVERISPEAPVPVVDVYHEENRLGGAANVALNLHSLGAVPVLCGITGEDSDGAEFRQLVETEGFPSSLIQATNQRRTTAKIRVLGNHQQVIRVDREDRQEISSSMTETLLKKTLKQMPDFDAVIIQDYDKGVISERLAHSVIDAANRQGIPVMVDPKFKNFFSFRGCYLFKPNLKELNEGMGERLGKNDLAAITATVSNLRQRMPHAHTLVTLSENGMLWVDEKGKGHHIGAKVRNITDVSGAGDTVISVAALAIAAGFSPLESGHLANIAGGLVCEEVGVVPIRKDALLAEFK